MSVSKRADKPRQKPMKNDPNNSKDTCWGNDYISQVMRLGPRDLGTYRVCEQWGPGEPALLRRLAKAFAARKTCMCKTNVNKGTGQILASITNFPVDSWWCTLRMRVMYQGWIKLIMLDFLCTWHASRHFNTRRVETTVKPVLSGHLLKIDKTNGNLMKVDSIDPFGGAFCNTFDLHQAMIGIENRFWCFLSGRLRQVLLYRQVDLDGEVDNQWRLWHVFVCT